MIPRPVEQKEDPPDTNSSSAPRMFAAALIIAAGVLFIVWMYARTLTPSAVTQRDYIEYWAAAQQLVRHADPYDFAAILKLERQNGMQTTEPRVCFSPPVALEAMLPLGWVGAKPGLIAWLIAELAAVMVSIWLVWRLCGRQDTRLHLLGLAFAPVVACQMAGQIGAFFLLCLVLFLAFHSTRPFLAGVALVPFALKPHLFVPFAIALLIWCLAQKKFSVLAGAFAALAASCAASLAIDPHAWAQYKHMTATYPLLDWFVPTVAMGLRYLLDQPARWIAFLPEAAGCAWAAWYAWSRRNRWNWMTHGQLVIMVSLLCAPYSWVTDQCLLLPAILAAILHNPKNGRALLLFLLMDGIMLWQVMTLATMTSFWFVWTAPAWLAWYLYATHSKRTRTPVAIAN